MLCFLFRRVKTRNSNTMKSPKTARKFSKNMQNSATNRQVISNMEEARNVLQTMKRKDLGEICKIAGIKVKGKNTEIIERLLKLPVILDLLKSRKNALPSISEETGPTKEDVSVHKVKEKKILKQNALHVEDKSKQNELHLEDISTQNQLHLEDNSKQNVSLELECQDISKQNVKLELESRDTSKHNVTLKLESEDISKEAILQLSPIEGELNGTFNVSDESSSSSDRRSSICEDLCKMTITETNNDDVTAGWCVIEGRWKETKMYHLVLRQGRVLLQLDDDMHVPLKLSMSSSFLPEGCMDNLVCEDCMNRNEVIRKRPRISSGSFMRTPLYEQHTDFEEKIVSILKSTAAGSEEERKILFSSRHHINEN